MKTYHISGTLLVCLFMMSMVSGALLIPLEQSGLRAPVATSEAWASEESFTTLPESRDRRFWIVAGAVAPELSAAQAIILDAKTGAEIFHSGDVDALQPVASLTKLLTARIAKHFLSAQKSMVISPADETPFGRQDLRVGIAYTKNDLFASLLINSSNMAGRAVARLSGLSPTDFLEAMNHEAFALGLTTSIWADPTGLASGNQASARDIARLLYEDLQDPYLRTFLSAAQYTLSTGENISSTNMLRLSTAQYDARVVAGKTGYIEEAGFSVAVLAHLPQKNHDVIVVVLGSQAHLERFYNARKLIDWAERYVYWRDQISLLY